MISEHCEFTAGYCCDSADPHSASWMQTRYGITENIVKSILMLMSNRKKTEK
jgi:hypothetical protein